MLRQGRLNVRHDSFRNRMSEEPPMQVRSESAFLKLRKAVRNAVLKEGRAFCEIGFPARRTVRLRYLFGSSEDLERDQISRTGLRAEEGRKCV
jgi:hypothetical protein